jgi:UDP-glucose 4-epimerase
MEVAAGMRDHIEIFGNDFNTPDGTGVRDYVHVTDLAEAHVLGLEYLAKNDKSFIVNLGSENGISVKEMVEKAREVTGRPVLSVSAPRRAGDPAKLVASSKKAGELLGWKAKHSDVGSLLSTTWGVYGRHCR